RDLTYFTPNPPPLFQDIFLFPSAFPREKKGRDGAALKFKVSLRKDSVVGFSSFFTLSELPKNRSVAVAEQNGKPTLNTFMHPLPVGRQTSFLLYSKLRSK
ncbi:hypothetical protein E2320_011764, partial [Naja naja]